MSVNDPGDVAGATSLASAATSVTMFGLSLSEVGVIISAAVAVATFAVHVWFTARKDKRAAELHRLRLQMNDLDGMPG